MRFLLLVALVLVGAGCLGGSKVVPGDHAVIIRAHTAAPRNITFEWRALREDGAREREEAHGNITGRLGHPGVESIKVPNGRYHFQASYVNATGILVEGRSALIVYGQLGKDDDRFLVVRGDERSIEVLSCQGYDC